MDEGFIQVYYGKGAGKSSAALGHAIRFASRGGAVYLIQFLKGPLASEYVSRMEPELKFFRFERSEESFDDMTDEQRSEEKKNVQNAIHFATKVMATGECDLLVLDEVLGVVSEGIISEDELCEALSKKSKGMSVILTGKVLTDKVRALADEVLNISKEK